MVAEFNAFVREEVGGTKIFVATDGTDLFEATDAGVLGHKFRRAATQRMQGLTVDISFDLITDISLVFGARPYRFHRLTEEQQNEFWWALVND